MFAPVHLHVAKKGSEVMRAEINALIRKVEALAAEIRRQQDVIERLSRATANVMRRPTRAGTTPD